MDPTRRTRCAVCTLTSLLLVLLHSVCHGEFIPPTNGIPAISQHSSIRVSQFCGDELQCRSQLTHTRCLQLDVCQEIQSCNGRTDFPPAEAPLNGWSVETVSAGCFVSDEKPNDLPSGLLFRQNTHTLTVNGSRGGDVTSQSCHVTRNSSLVGDAFSLSFWIKADCANCSVIDLSNGDPRSVHVRVVDGDHVCVGEDCTPNEHLLKGQWAFIALTAYQGALRLYLDGDKVKEFQLPGVNNVALGSTEDVLSDSLVYILHAQFFEDTLTPREITEKYTGLVDPTAGACRCTPDYPHISNSQDSLCVNGEGKSTARYNSTVDYNPPEVTLDGSRSNWASAEQGPVTLMIDLKQSFQIESIEVIFVEPPPSQITYRLISDGKEKEERYFVCSTNDCRITLGSLDKATTLETFDTRKADGIKIVLHRDHNDDVRSFIISKITISGRCDCNGNAGACIVNGNTYTCSCEAGTNTQGPNCRSCLPNFFRQPQDFDCTNDCKCFKDGVTDESNQCDENGGKCYCKEHVEGFSCDVCKPWTYNLDSSNNKGCSACPCFQSGSDSCSNSTGICTCKKNVALPNCQACIKNHYGFIKSQECEACNCEPIGTIKQNLKCSDQEGQCDCKANVDGRTCNTCKAGFYNLKDANPLGCDPCGCNPVGVENLTCHPLTGQCPCRGDVITDRTCTPAITSIDPTYGPLIGGTDIVISGKLLGQNIKNVSIGNIAQTITTVNDSTVVIKTKAKNTLAIADLKVTWSNNEVTASSSFSYQRDPIISGSEKVQASFVSGGCHVKLFGTSLRSVKYPYLDVIVKGKPQQVARGVCYHVAGIVVCVTPDVTDLFTSESDSYEMTAVFDGVNLRLGDIQIKKDPVIESAGDIEFQYPFEDTITIKGKGFLSACETNEYTVLIGVRRCDIKRISDTRIECEPPTIEPKGTDKVPITVNIGNVHHRVGTLEYLDLHETTGFIIIISCIFAVIVIIVVIFIARCFIAHRRRHPKVSRAAKTTADGNTHSDTRQMNTYTELDCVTNNPRSNGQNGTIRVESVVREHKKGIVNTEAETNVLQDEFLPHVEPSLRTDVTSCFVGGGSFGMGSTCILAGNQSQLVEGTLQRNGRVVTKLVVKTFVSNIKGNLNPPGDENSLLVPWAQQVLKECLRFRKHKHNHLLHTVGIGIKQQRIHILYQHMSKGPLKNLVSNTEQDYSVRKLLGFSQQVAEGIAFLASKDITHKDVAARNCMVDEYSVVKIGDASFAWDYYPNEYVYSQERERYLPLRWMSPESIDHGYYDMRTDVWSFGVMVWELLTRGCLPFHEVQDSDVGDYVLNGYILGKPEFISNNLYNLLRNCWSPENESRPSIAAVSSALCNILEADDEDSTYANIGSLKRPHNTEAQFYSSTNISGV